MDAVSSTEPSLSINAGTAAFTPKQARLDVEREELVESSVESIDRGVDEAGAVVEHPGIADEGVEPAEQIEGACHGPLVVVGDRDVADDPGNGAGVGRLDRRHPIGRAVEGDDSRSLRDEAIDQCATQPRSGAGDERHVTLEPAHARTSYA